MGWSHGWCCLPPAATRRLGEGSEGFRGFPQETVHGKHSSLSYLGKFSASIFLKKHLKGRDIQLLGIQNKCCFESTDASVLHLLKEVRELLPMYSCEYRYCLSDIILSRVLRPGGLGEFLEAKKGEKKKPWVLLRSRGQKWNDGIFGRLPGPEKPTPQGRLCSFLWFSH